jgi:HAD superfamily hydrolase (TIGR01493 family)
MPPVRGVLLDWGHTLFDTAGSVEFIVSWTADAGSPITVDDAAEFHLDALRRSRAPEELAKGRDLSLAVHRECWLALWADLDARCPGVAAALYEFETSAAGWQPYPDTPAFLGALRELGLPVVIVSDVPFDLRPIFDHYGLLHLVDTFVLSVEHGTIKPEGRLFEIALDAVGLEPHDVVMVGDNPANDGAAVLHGIRTLLLPHPKAGASRGLDDVLQLIGRSSARSRA